MKVTNARGRVRVAALAAVSLLAMGPASAQETVSYTYDALGRVIAVNHGTTGPNANISSSYTYDKADNRTGVTVSTAPAPCSGVSFAASNNPSGNEGTNLSFTVTKTGTTSDTCSVSYQTADGTAHAGTNYTAKALTSLSFASTATSKTVSVATLDDHVVTGDLNMYLNLSAPSGASTISDSQSVGTIHNIDVASTCSGVSFSVGNASAHAGVTLSFTVTKTGTTSNTCTVSYATRDGTATTANGDYTATSGSLSFASSVTTQTVSVPTFDNGWSTTVNMYLDLSNPSGAATITTGTGIGSILSNGGICPQSPTGTSTSSTSTTDTTSTSSADTTSTSSPDSTVQPMQPIC
jgi:hypothetical protein